MKAIIFTIIIAFNVIGALRLKEKQISIRTKEEGKEEQEDIHVHYGNIDIKVIKKKKKEYSYTNSLILNIALTPKPPMTSKFEIIKYLVATVTIDR